jgi:hypothetical protein
MKLTTNLHQVSRLKISGAVFPFSPYDFFMHRVNILRYATEPFSTACITTLLEKKRVVEKILQLPEFYGLRISIIVSKRECHWSLH